jgi:hypothetical protein
MYHTLIHYKFRLMLKVRERLEAFLSNRPQADVMDAVENLLEDNNFTERETER